MVNIIPSDLRHRVDAGWLTSRWHFSFSDYQDPANMGFSVLRVFNDDIVQPQQGFGMHPHRDMEIISYIVSGELEHRDHIGHRGVVKAGGVQTMSAGKGIMHSESNPSQNEPVHFLQIWIHPRTRGSTPRYQDAHFEPTQHHNAWLTIVSPGDVPGSLPIDQDAACAIATLDAGRSLTHDIRPGRSAYLFVISGAVTLNRKAMSAGDQARISGESRLDLAAAQDAHVMLIDLP
jgi:hypothetical protein